MPLLDIDTLIEEECSERIPAIFARHGEEYFRSCESLVLERATRMGSAAIISTGGGIVARAENRALMAERGVRVYLQIDPDSAIQRLQAQLELEPILVPHYITCSPCVLTGIRKPNWFARL